jgi:hypothetical protein
MVCLKDCDADTTTRRCRLHWDSREFAMDVVLIMEFVVNAVLIIVALLLMASAIWVVSRKS